MFGSDCGLQIAGLGCAESGIPCVSRPDLSGIPGRIDDRNGICLKITGDDGRTAVKGSQN